MQITDIEQSPRTRELLTRKLALDFGNDKLNVVVRATGLTQATRELARTADTDEEQVEALAAVLVDLVDEWDLEAGGAPVPLTLDAVSAIPMPVIAAIYAAIEAELVAARDPFGGTSGRSKPRSKQGAKRRKR